MRITVLTYSRQKSHMVSAVSVIAGWKLIHPKRLNILDFSANIVPSYTDVSFKDINDEFELKGWYFNVTGSSKTVIKKQAEFWREHHTSHKEPS